MKRTMTRAAVLMAVLTLALVVPGTAAAGSAHLSARVVTPSPWQVLDSATTTLLAPSGGAVTVTLRELAPAGRRGASIRTFEAEAKGLASGSRLLLLVDGRQLGELEADAAGRAMLRVASGPYEAGWTVVAPGILGRAALSAIQLVEAGTGAGAAGFLYSRSEDESADGDVYADWTPLCPPAMSDTFGGAGVYRDDTIQVLDLFAAGLEPGATFSVEADGVGLGDYEAGGDGTLVLEFSTDPDATGSLPLPEALVPVDAIDVVRVVSSDTAVLEGSFRQPCSLEMPEPEDWGGFELCPAGDDGSAWGFYGWTAWDDGRQDAVVEADGVEPGAEVTVLFDGVAVGTAVADEGGSVWLCLSTEACCGMLPLPEAVLPLSAVEHVSVEVAGSAVLEGMEGETCDGGWEPPALLESAQTPLCPSGPGIMAAGLAGWDRWDDGNEDFWIVASGLTPGAAYTVTVDGTSFEVTAGDWGGLDLMLSTDPDTFGGEPLPDALSPVASVDQVAVASSDAAVMEGRFSDPCDGTGGGGVPPTPSDAAATPLCPEEGGTAWGVAGWAVFDDPEGEAFGVAADGLEPGGTYALDIDGRVVGSYTADDAGTLILDFCTDPDTLGCSAPMPDAVGPVAAIDVVRLVGSDGSAVLSGSFSDPCDGTGGWTPPTPVDMDQTPLCAADGGDAMGVAGWTVFENPDAEAFGVFASGLEPGIAYRLVVNGTDAGSWTADSWGEVMIDLCTDPDTLGCSEPLPDALSPVSAIDTVALVGPAGEAVVAGSFSEPCDPSSGGGGGFDADADVTGLCDAAMGLETGQAGWTRTEGEDGSAEEQIGVVYIPFSGGGTYTVVIDGVTAGTMDASFGVGELVLSSTGWPNPLPPELSPVDGIDVVQILDENGSVVAEGSFSNPCSDGGMPMALRHRTVVRHAAVTAVRGLAR